MASIDSSAPDGKEQKIITTLAIALGMPLLLALFALLASWPHIKDDQPQPSSSPKASAAVEPALLAEVDDSKPAAGEKAATNLANEESGAAESGIEQKPTKVTPAVSSNDRKVTEVELKQPPIDALAGSPATATDLVASSGTPNTVGGGLSQLRADLKAARQANESLAGVLGAKLDGSRRARAELSGKLTHLESRLDRVSSENASLKKLVAQLNDKLAQATLTAPGPAAQSIVVASNERYEVKIRSLAVEKRQAEYKASVLSRQLAQAEAFQDRVASSAQAEARREFEPLVVKVRSLESEVRGQKSRLANSNVASQKLASVQADLEKTRVALEVWKKLQVASQEKIVAWQKVADERQIQLSEVQSQLRAVQAAAAAQPPVVSTPAKPTSGPNADQLQKLVQMLNTKLANEASARVQLTRQIQTMEKDSAKPDLAQKLGMQISELTKNNGLLQKQLKSVKQQAQAQDKRYRELKAALEGILKSRD